MRVRKTTNRSLRAESLESRQLLHGGALAGAGEPPTSEVRATEVVSRFDANEDMELSEDEVPERLWNRISASDGDDDNSTVSAEELTAHLDALPADGRDDDLGERDRGQDRNRVDRGERVSVEERIDRFFAENDSNMDGVITDADEVSEELLANIADADIDGDGVSAADLLARHEANQQARAQARFDARFARLDDNGDGAITIDEVSEGRWERISAADGEDGDGRVTSDELQTYRDAQRAERQADRSSQTEEDNSEETEEIASDNVALAEPEGSQRGRGQNQRRGGGQPRGRG